MRHQTILKILGILLSLFSVSLVPPLVLSVVFSDHSQMAFLLSLVATLATGMAFYLPTRRQRRDLRLRDGFLVVVLSWTVLAAFGALPLLLSSNPLMSVTDAFFESMSGLTTTGATVLVGIDDLPISVRYYRQQLQWLGGMGIIVLAVAVMPMLGIGGMQLYRAETPGPMKNTKLTPRITETAKALWYIYLGLTVACALAYWLGGMTLFDAISHSFSTVAIGGFSTHDNSIAYFDSPVISAIAAVFMIIAAMNFALHFLALRRRSIAVYLLDTEVRVFVGLLLLVTVLTCVLLWWSGTFGDGLKAFWHGAFQVISIGTTTGFTTSEFHLWPSLLPVLLVMMSGIGGCAGSTAGGVKVIRMILLYKQGGREINQLIHPSAFLPIKLGGKPVQESVVNAIWGFFALYIFSYLVLALAMTASGADPLTAFSSVTACLNNLGPGLGAVADNYAQVEPSGKWILSGAMLMGRLELFTLLVLLTPAFWRS